MVPHSEIVAYVNEVVRHFHPDRIILFGSHAEGAASEDSDVDLLVEMDHAHTSLQQALAIRRAVKRDFPLDLVVKSRQEIHKRILQNDFFIKSIVDRGQVLYERAG
jgi:predicted nucleotidyltransferase